MSTTISKNGGSKSLSVIKTQKFINSVRRGGVAGSEVALRPQPYCAKRNGGCYAVLGSLLRNSARSHAIFVNNILVVSPVSAKSPIRSAKRSQMTVWVFFGVTFYLFLISPE